jgi:uncharacterized protein YcaQ
MERISIGQARRIAIAAQGLAKPRPSKVTARHINSVIDRLKLIQIDAVTALERAHYLPLFSRLGPYNKDLLDRATSRAPRRLVETWAHEASFVPPDVYPLFGWRRDNPERYAWGQMRQAARDHPEVVAAVRRALADRPLSAKQLQSHLKLPEQRLRTGNPWGNWTVAKGALEWLFMTGEVTAAGRTRQFERIYALAEQVVPGLAQANPGSHGDQQRQLVEHAARAHGIAQIRSLADYYRLPLAATRTAVADLVEDRVLKPTLVAGLNETFYVPSDVTRPRRTHAQCLLSPFDSLIFDRQRVAHLFDMHYRLEYYLPASRRVYGYFVMPFLLGEELVARVDVKSDRRQQVLRVQSAWLEPGAEHDAVRSPLAQELRQLATWLGFDDLIVRLDGPGELTAALAQELGSRTAQRTATQNDS